MSSKHITWVALGLCAGFASGCGDSDEKSDPAVAQAVMSELVSSVDTTVTGYQSGGAGGGSVKLQCEPGGSATVDGHVKVEVKPIGVDVQVAIAYDACQTKSGSTINGSIDFTQTVQAGATPVRVETVYQGDVKLTGKVQADCAVDVHVLVDEAGKTVKVSGSVCGNDAAGLNLQVSPRWKS